MEGAYRVFVGAADADGTGPCECFSGRGGCDSGEPAAVVESHVRRQEDPVIRQLHVEQLQLRAR